MTAALAFARAHWRALCVALGLVLAFAGGRWSKRQPPATAVALKQDTAVQKRDAEDLTQRKAEGPVRIVTKTVTKYRDRPVAEVDKTVTETRGPVVTDTHATSSENFVENSHVELKLTPPPSGPRFAVGVGIEDPLGAQRPHFELGMRALTVPLLDLPLWLRLGSTPSRGLLHGATISGEIQW